MAGGRALREQGSYAVSGPGNRPARGRLPPRRPASRRALQISDGSVTGLVDTPFSATVHVFVALIPLRPLVRKAPRRNRT
jgi:hypothetical protein